MQIYINEAKEDWIVDRLREEWYFHNPQTIPIDVVKLNVIWLIAPWMWRVIDPIFLKNTLVVATIHHIVPEKFNVNEFKYRDVFVDAYHVLTEQTKVLIQKHTNKPIYLIPSWFDSEKWKPLDKDICRKELGLPDKFIIGSFQRDTEGKDLVSPKLEKGPDLFVEYLKKIREEEDIHVLLGGYRRQYVKKRLDILGIPYTYNENADIELLKKMYASLDCYVVSSRCEGGPQALFECAAMKVPIVSRDVGNATLVLNDNCIIDIPTEVYYPTYDDIQDIYNNVQKYNIDILKYEYLNMFKEIIGV